MIIVFLLYLLLATPVWGTIDASAHSLHGEATVSLRFAGVELVHHTAQDVGENGWLLSALPIFGAPNQKKAKDEGAARIRKRIERLIRRTARIERLRVTMRIGLGDAWATALASGGARAAMLSVLSAFTLPPDASVCVMPDFAASGFCAHLRCIFSITAGDIILKAVALKTRKGNSPCSSIPFKI